ncbi:MAG: hypothetical protein OQK32_08370 [Gammaproteobacteria bacterium]|nr:hypothetical protein [Gammaproteobacteria bacterium]
MKHCCEVMQTQVTHKCEQHPDPFECPDSLIYYSDKFDEYGIIIHDGGSSFSAIAYCPWCGKRLPESKRDRWFDELEAMGYDDPAEQDIPPQYTSGEWYRA